MRYSWLSLAFTSPGLLAMSRAPYKDGVRLSNGLSVVVATAMAVGACFMLSIAYLAD